MPRADLPPTLAAPLTLAPALDNLAVVQDYVCRQATAAGGSEALCGRIQLVMEELFVNIVNHARHEQDVEITCSWKSDTNSFCIALRDWGPRFNPLEAAPPSLDADLDARPIGGLGIHLVRQMTDDCAYERQDESNLLTACFIL